MKLSEWDWQIINSRHIDMAWRPIVGWKFRLDKCWGGKIFGFQAGYLLIAIWR